MALKIGKTVTIDPRVKTKKTPQPAARKTSGPKGRPKQVKVPKTEAERQTVERDRKERFEQRQFSKEQQQKDFDYAKSRGYSDAEAMEFAGIKRSPQATGQSAGPGSGRRTGRDDPYGEVRSTSGQFGKKSWQRMTEGTPGTAALPGTSSGVRQSGIAGLGSTPVGLSRSNAQRILLITYFIALILITGQEFYVKKEFPKPSRYVRATVVWLFLTLGAEFIPPAVPCAFAGGLILSLLVAKDSIVAKLITGDPPLVGKKTSSSSSSQFVPGAPSTGKPPPPGLVPRSGAGAIK